MEIEFDISPEDRRQRLDFAHSVAKGLIATPKRLDCRYLYDDHGSRLFERICEQPEYYLTRAEQAILLGAADEIARLTGPVSLIEFGSGNSMKTKILLDAYSARYGAVRYTPVDISRSILKQAHRQLMEAVPLVTVKPLHGTYDEAFHLFGSFSPMLFLFLGSTIGNLDTAEATNFWTRISTNLSRGDYCLLGIDITEDAEALHAAYNDAAGFSAEFTKNIFARMNRELGASVDTDTIEHVARYKVKRRRVEIFAEFHTAQRIKINPLGRTVAVNKSDLVMTEISRKFRVDETIAYLKPFELSAEQVFVEKNRRFAVLLLQRK